MSGLPPREMLKLITKVQTSPKRLMISDEWEEQDLQSLKSGPWWKQARAIMSTSFAFKNLAFRMAQPLGKAMMQNIQTYS